MSLQNVSNTVLFDAQHGRILARLREPSVVQMLPRHQRDAVAHIDGKTMSYDQFAQIPLATKTDIFGADSPLLTQEALLAPKHFVPAAGTSRELLAFRFRDPESETAMPSKPVGLIATSMSLAPI